jgi:voltage-gated potassium channel Kch
MSTIISFVLATYLMSHNDSLVRHFRTFFAWWDPSVSKAESLPGAIDLSDHIVLVGAHRTGQSVLHALGEFHKQFIVIDFNPTVVKKLKQQGINVVFGDIGDPDIQEKANIEKAKLIISTIPSYQDNVAVIEAVRLNNKKAKIILSALDDLEARKLYEKGASYILMPHFLSGLQLAEILKKDGDLKNIDKLKTRDLNLLELTS